MEQNERSILQKIVVSFVKKNLKAQGRPNLADGISLYVSDDRKVATCVTPVASEFPDQDGAWVI